MTAIRALAMAGLLVFLHPGALAQPVLVGQWKSDADRTMRFNKERARLDDKKVAFLSQLMGRMTITFTEDSIAYDMPDTDMHLGGGKVQRFEGSRETHLYSTLGHTRNTVAVRSKAPVVGNEAITVYNFEDANTMWVYVGGADMGLPDEHLREYFVRK
jgi:hypothetical protein